MSLLGDLVGSAASASPIGSILDIGSKIVDRLIPDPAAAAQAKLELARMEQTGELAALAAGTDLAKAQLSLDTVEAANPNVFVSGWHPYIGWICGTCFGYVVMLQPFLSWISHLLGSTVAPPVIDTSIMVPLMLTMLGVAGAKTYENVKTK